MGLFEKDWAQYDRDHPDRPRGAGERTGRLAGAVAGASQAPRYGRAAAHVLLRYGVKPVPRIGGALVAGYGAIKVGQAAGGYVGRKVDEAVGRVFKGSVEQTMHEYKHGRLRSGSKTGPKVTDRKQAIAIALSQAGLSNR